MSRNTNQSDAKRCERINVSQYVSLYKRGSNKFRKIRKKQLSIQESG